MLDLLLSNCEADEECRSVVAECLGALCLLCPDRVLPALCGALGADASPNARAVAVVAARHLVLERPHAVDAALAAAMPQFLERLGDEDRWRRGSCVFVCVVVVVVGGWDVAC